MTNQQEYNRSQCSNDGIRSQYHWLLQQIFFWLYHIFVFIFGIVILTRILFAYYSASDVHTSNNYRYAQQTIQLWNKGYIIDIRAVNTNNCPSGYQPLINYNWSGTSQGCYCSASLNKHEMEIQLKGACTSQLIAQGCEDINEIGGQPLHIWKGGKLLCQKRIDALSFYSSSIPTTLDGISMKKCADQQQYAMYTLQNISCPISLINNISVGSLGNQIQLDNQNNHNLYYRSSLGYPIAQFKLTEFQFCPFFEQINISPDKSGNYLLQIESKTTTCSGNDPRIIQFDQLGQQDFYTNNTRVYDRISELPGYPTPSNSYQYKLGFLRYPSWSYECRTSQTHSLSIATHHILFTTPLSSLQTCLAITIPAILLFVFFIRIFFIIRHSIELKQRVQYNILMLTDEQITQRLPMLAIHKQFGYESCIFIFELLLRLASLFAIIYSLNMLMDSSVWIKFSFVRGCSDSFIDGILRDYQNIIDYMSGLMVEAIIVFIVLFVMDIIYFIVRVYWGDLTKRYVKQISNEQFEVDDEKSAHLKAQQSAEVILQKQSQIIHVFDADHNYLFANKNTGENFYKLAETSSIVKKKKKKKNLQKKKNRFNSHLQ